eukprot:TRINITY_DN398_c0_g1_i1.p1 TRINITY_DN398_c0_g1~~TRINITY_DN398_c0_g1_i1.p1  ORF type:complete len:464 (-),score=156.27 TRINITY_DN398_c0_g1_i1:160-1551(-)
MTNHILTTESIASPSLTSASWSEEKPERPKIKKGLSGFFVRKFKKARSIEVKRENKGESVSSPPLASPSWDSDRPLTENDFYEIRKMVEAAERPESHSISSIESVSEENLMDSKKHDIGTNEEVWNSLLPVTFAQPSQSLKTNVNKVAILYNPRSGNKRGEKLAEMAAQVMENNCIKVDLIQLERRGHAEELLETMDVTPYDVICILGGDGTFHEAVNGYMKRTDDARLKVPLAVLPGGTGNSLVLELTGSVHLKTSIEHVMRGLSAPIDIGELYFPTKAQKMYSFNSLHFGMASKVNEHAERLRWMGKAVRYTTAAVMELVKGKKEFVVLETVDKYGNRAKTLERYSFIIANNIRTAAKGMKIAPDGKLNDGLIDLILVKSSKTIDLARVFQGFYDGSHVNYDFVDYMQVKEFSVVPYAKPEEGREEDAMDVAEELLDVDGELTGTTPFQCKMIKQAIRIIV